MQINSTKSTQPPLLRHIFDNPLPLHVRDVIYGWSLMVTPLHEKYVMNGVGKMNVIVDLGLERKLLECTYKKHKLNVIIMD